MVDPYAERCLRTFNEKAAHLNGSPFLAAVNSGKTSFVWHMQPGRGIEAERNLPDRYDIDGFVLTLRMFVQFRDGISLHQVADLYDQLPVPVEMRTEVRAITTV